MMQQRLKELLRCSEGILKLSPTYVHRFYPDFNRLKQNQLKRSRAQFIPERWIGSSVEAVNAAPIPSGGFSVICGTRIAFRDAVREMPIELIGETLFRAHGPEFRVLVKILDPGEPIVFHLHATDQQVKRMPQHFAGHRFGKDEVYYFLDAPKGPQPYTHAGLHKGVTKRDLIRAIARGREATLELSPSFYQESGTGFFVPAGVPHRPGTALTLEIQQPSDVYTLLETHAGGRKLKAQQMHPGFASIDAAFELIDMKRSLDVGSMKNHRISPRKAAIADVFPKKLCQKFSGQRIRTDQRITYRRVLPFLVWIWKGELRINGQRYRAGDECFVTDRVARAGIEIEPALGQFVELFTFNPEI